MSLKSFNSLFLREENSWFLRILNWISVKTSAELLGVTLTFKVGNQGAEVTVQCRSVNNWWCLETAATPWTRQHSSFDTVSGDLSVFLLWSRGPELPSVGGETLFCCASPQCSQEYSALSSGNSSWWFSSTSKDDFLPSMQKPGPCLLEGLPQQGQWQERHHKDETSSLRSGRHSQSWCSGWACVSGEQGGRKSGWLPGPLHILLSGGRTVFFEWWQPHAEDMQLPSVWQKSRIWDSRFALLYQQLKINLFLHP